MLVLKCLFATLLAAPLAGWGVRQLITVTPLDQQQFVNTQPPAITVPTQTQEVRLLTPGVPLASELTGGVSHLYRLTLAAGQYLRIEVEQRGVDVVVALSGPDGRKVTESNVPLAKLEWVSVIAETEGEWRLEIRAADPAAPAGRYEVKLAERREAVEVDRQRVAADRAFAAGRQLRTQVATEARRDAAKQYEEALALYRAAGDHRGEAFTLSGLGATLSLLGERRRVAELYQQALPLVQALEERLAESHLLTSLGELCNALNEKQQALDYFKQALPLWRELGERSREASTYFSLGVVYGSLGDRQQAITYSQQALALYRSLGNQRGEANALAAIGGSYEALGEKQKALDNLHQALTLWRALGEKQSEAQTLHLLGMTYDSLNERQKAVEYFNQALTLRRSVGHYGGKAVLDNELGNIYTGLGDHRQALTHYQQALAQYEADKDYVGIARLLRNIGLVYDTLGEKQQAAAYYQRALPLFRLGSDRQSHARLLANLGKVLSESGAHEQALTHLNEALARLRQLNNQFFEVYTLYWIAHAERGRGHLAEARARLEEALGKIEYLRRSFYQPELRAVGFTKAQDFYELEIDLLVRQHESQPDAKLVAAALEASEQARARTMLDLLAEARIEIRQGIAAPLREREQAIQTRFSALQSQLIQAHQQAKPDQPQIATLRAELKQTDEEREQLERELRRQHPRYAEMLYPEPLRAAAIRQLLDHETALLEYVLGNEASFLFVVTRAEVRCFRLPKGSDPAGLAALVQEARATLGQPGRREFANYVQAARKLYDLLLAPAAGALAQKQKLLIAPAGALYYLPFEGLIAKSAGDSPRASYQSYQELGYLLKRWAISYVPSASVLASLRRNATAPAERAPGAPPKQLLAFADPVYSLGPANEAAKAEKDSTVANSQALRSLFEQAGRWELARLSESKREVTQIAQLYPASQTALFFGSAATEENVKGNPDVRTARRLHFATHGIISERQPQHSGLVLTLDADPKEDGLLQVYEIFNLKLQAELVVLSACQTGLGQELKGEGLIGLTRAFMYAGVPSVVVSLWQVADASTAELMVKFYQQLERAPDKAEALRRAKLELLRQPRYAHPYYWAPFVLVGEPR